MIEKIKILKFIKNFELSKRLTLMIILAFTFSFLVRLYWVFWANKYPDLFFWNNELMINTNDGYAFAEGARDRLAGFHQPNDLSYYSFPLSILTAFLAKILPFSFEHILLYMSAFFSSLIVVPILLISAEFRCLRAGFIGALVACVANSYYNRTMVGYYDTDMLNIVLAMFVLWALIRTSVKNDRFCLIYIAFFTTFYNWWYPSSFSLNSAFFGLFVIYTLIWQRKKILNYQALILMLLSLTAILIYIKILLLIALIWLFFKKANLFEIRKNLAITAGIVVLLFIICGGLTPILFQLKFYIFRSVADNSEITYRFFNVNQTIQESGFVSNEIFAKRISSSVIVFLCGLVGYFLLCFRHKEFLLSLPMLALGFMAYKAGLRFTIYAVPIMAFSFAYLSYYLVKISKLPKFLGRLILLFVTIMALYPALNHIKNYLPGSVFYKSEVEILDKFKSIAEREDYTLAWWDYGYPIRYYADTKTLIDGGKHLGNDNFPVSFALTKDQTSAANMARIDVEYTELSYKERYGEKFTKILKDYNYKPNEINEFLLSLRSKIFMPPPARRDIYFYLPDRMMSIFNIVAKFSNLDLLDGHNFAEPFFYIGGNYGINEKGMNLGENIYLSNDLLSVELNGTKVRINSFYKTKYENGKLAVERINIDNSSPLFVVVMSDYDRILILDEKAFNSAYIQLFVLENFDRDLYEPVILSPVAKIFKLKR